MESRIALPVITVISREQVAIPWVNVGDLLLSSSKLLDWIVTWIFLRIFEAEKSTKFYRNLWAQESPTFLNFILHPLKLIDSTFPGVPHLEFIFDLLVHPEGPRLRDKVSHFELEWSGDLETRFRTSSELVFSIVHDLVSYFNPFDYWLAESLTILLEYSSRRGPTGRILNTSKYISTY